MLVLKDGRSVATTPREGNDAVVMFTSTVMFNVFIMKTDDD